MEAHNVLLLPRLPVPVEPVPGEDPHLLLRLPPAGEGLVVRAEEGRVQVHLVKDQRLVGSVERLSAVTERLLVLKPGAEVLEKVDRGERENLPEVSGVEDPELNLPVSRELLEEEHDGPRAVVGVHGGDPELVGLGDILNGEHLRLVVKDVHDEGGRQEGSLSPVSSLHDDVGRDGAADELTPDSFVQLSLLQ